MLHGGTGVLCPGASSKLRLQEFTSHTSDEPVIRSCEHARVTCVCVPLLSVCCYVYFVCERPWE
jgi:hypothetical protein